MINDDETQFRSTDHGSALLSRRISPLERHAQSLIQIVIAALLVWMGNSMITLREQMVSVQRDAQSIAGINDRMTGIENRLANSTVPNAQNTWRIDILERKAEELRLDIGAVREEMRAELRSKGR